MIYEENFFFNKAIESVSCPELDLGLRALNMFSTFSVDTGSNLKEKLTLLLKYDRYDLFPVFTISLASLGPIVAKYSLNLFEMLLLPFIAFPLRRKIDGYSFLLAFLFKIIFTVFHVFLMFP